MSTINYAQKEISCKIVYYGPGLCGKTTNLQFIHEVLPQENRGELVSLATQQDRTLFFDFLPMDLGKVKGFDTKFHLYTVPGQVYYNATRKLVLRGVDGIVFVADSQKDRLEENVNSLQNLKDNLGEYGYDLPSIPWVIQYNKRDLDNIASVKELSEMLNKTGVPEFESIAITGEGVRETLKCVSGLVLQRMKKVAEKKVPAKTTLSSLADRGEEEIVTAEPPPDMFKKSSAPSFTDERIPMRRQFRKERENPLDGILPVTIDCMVYWGNIKIGRGAVTVENIDVKDLRKQYHLSGSFKYLGVFPGKIDQDLVFRAMRTLTYSPNEGKYFQLVDPPSQRPALEQPFYVYIKKDDNHIFFSRKSIIGRFYVTPLDGYPLREE